MIPLLPGMHSLTIPQAWTQPHRRGRTLPTTGVTLLCPGILDKAQTQLMKVQRWCLSLSNILFHLLCHMFCLPQEECLVLEKHFLYLRDILPRYSLSLSLSHQPSWQNFFIYFSDYRMHIRNCYSYTFMEMFSGFLRLPFSTLSPLWPLSCTTSSTKVLMLSVYPFPLNMFLRGDLTSHLNTSVCSICCILFRLQL